MTEQLRLASIRSQLRSSHWIHLELEKVSERLLTWNGQRTHCNKRIQVWLGEGWGIWPSSVVKGFHQPVCGNHWNGGQWAATSDFSGRESGDQRFPCDTSHVTRFYCFFGSDCCIYWSTFGAGVCVGAGVAFPMRAFVPSSRWRRRWSGRGRAGRKNAERTSQLNDEQGRKRLAPTEPELLMLTLVFIIPKWLFSSRDGSLLVSLTSRPALGRCWVK